jgi:hypothetical protein
MSRYASQTNVSTDQSIGEIRKTLSKYGASKFGLITDENSVVIAFEMQDRRIRFTLQLPNPKDKRFWLTPEKGLRRTPEKAAEAYEQACRQRYRALALTIKAKLESVESGIETFEEAFLAKIVMPDGSTIGEWAAPQIAQVYGTGKMPPLLPGATNEIDRSQGWKTS